MITREQYLKDPCGSLSIPYWKAAEITLPDNVKILHHRQFSGEPLRNFRDEPYFRLKHDLQSVPPADLQEGFFLDKASPEEFAAHIGGCYSGVGISAEELKSYTSRKVYCPELWIAVRDTQTGEIAASGIGELDRDLGEGCLEWIQVSDSFRRRGLGRFIVTELLRRMQGRAAFATVSGQCANETGPEVLYRKCGFAGNDVWHILRKG